MKRIILASAAAMLLLSACGPSKQDFKKDIVDACMTGAKDKLVGMEAMPGMNENLTQYCDCVGNKATENLSVAELKEVQKDRNSAKSQEVQQKIAPLTQPCMNDMMARMQKNTGAQ